MWLTVRNILIAVMLGVLTVWSAVGTGFNLPKLIDSLWRFKEIFDLWFPPNWERSGSAFNAILMTLQMAFLGTFLALFIVLPLSFLAAANTSPNSLLYQLTRGIFSFLRSIPDIVIGLILVMAIGPGPFPAVMAILLHNIGVLGKLIAELVEASDKGPQEAVRSVGLGRAMVALYGILPQIIPNVLSHYFYRFEVAIRSSVILGFLGGGGIGQLLFNSFRTFQYADVTTYVIFVMLLVILVDMVGGLIRQRVI
ncbi:phosphonate transport system permease protein [Caldalkalibacillus uzonensis]|uniref:Phosphonate transport system permease protein n=1 Tax=Caldalkalibacillus uzonensis TaxID=353224 RepID=A0ABU0CTW4_9BACI|nr:phosphonate ABC transporter, permease protein PhnE [Caldalkalibacillus uzonensis]MDQ0339868.1 phosphonate transport system permease protein [Caldalkalibacillus uzonensis]